MALVSVDYKEEFREKLFVRAIKDVAQKAINRKIKREKYNFTVDIIELKLRLISTNKNPVDLSEFLPD